MHSPGDWYDTESAQEDWVDSLAIDEGQLQDLLDVAQEQILAYAPALAEDAPIPDSYAMAQLMQARNIWNAQKASPGGEIGEGTFALRPFPLDWMVRQLLRPKRAVPVIF